MSPDRYLRDRSALPTAPRVLVIMDVDGTMLLNGRALRDEFLRAFHDVTGRHVPDNAVSYAGNTDRRIVREFMAATGVEEAFERIYPAVERRFIELVERSYDRHPEPYVLVGVEDLLSALHDHPDVGLVLGTGNVRETCEIKLRRFGLDRYFPHGGGFGGDHEVRADAIRAAMDVGRRAYGWVGEAWVVGDTLNDLHAAREAGARCLLVGTGPHGMAELVNAGADAALADLSDTRGVLEALGLSLPVGFGRAQD